MSTYSVLDAAGAEWKGISAYMGPDGRDGHGWKVGYPREKKNTNQEREHVMWETAGMGYDDRE